LWRRTLSGLMFTLLLIGVLTLTVDIKQAKSEWTGTVYIRADGSIDPSDAPVITYDNVTYTLTDNITSSADGIVVERDNIVIDGDGYTLQGAGSGKGVDLSGRTNVTIKNTQIKNFYHGIELYSSSNVTISGNNITNNIIGVRLYHSSNNTVSGNNITANDYGVSLDSSSNNSITGNNITENNNDGIALLFSNNIIVRGNIFINGGLRVFYSYQNSVKDNFVNGKPLVYLENVLNYTVNDAGQVILVKCANIKVEGLNLSRTNFGVELWGTSSSTISTNDITANSYFGVGLYFGSSNNSVIGNNITDNEYGVRLYYSSNHNIVSGNNVTNNIYGVWLFSSSNNVVSRNKIKANHQYGIYIDASFNDIVSVNSITKNGWGIYISGSSNHNTVNGNNVTANHWGGVGFTSSSNNIIYHNNFIDNVAQIQSDDSTNIWDDGYPSGGNYWSDYAGVDLFSGFYQNETGSDGIGDTPYAIDVNNTDRYPLMAPFTAFDVGVWNGTACNVDVVSNSTLSDFKIDLYGKTLSFNVTGVENQTGFCRITIPNIIVEDLWHGNYTVLLNGEPWPFRNWTDTENTYIYLNYTHSTHQITIIPEYPSAITILLLLTVLLITIPVKRKLLKKSSPT